MIIATLDETGTAPTINEAAAVGASFLLNGYSFACAIQALSPECTHCSCNTAPARAVKEG
jgi:hypothetical protein